MLAPCALVYISFQEKKTMAVSLSKNLLNFNLDGIFIMLNGSSKDDPFFFAAGDITRTARARQFFFQWVDA